MKVRMLGSISGTRDAAPWPAPGGVLDLPDDEGVTLCAQGMAAPIVEDGVERAVPEVAEERGLATRTGPVRKSRK